MLQSQYCTVECIYKFIIIFTIELLNENKVHCTVVGVLLVTESVGVLLCLETVELLPVTFFCRPQAGLQVGVSAWWRVLE